MPVLRGFLAPPAPLPPDGPPSFVPRTEIDQPADCLGAGRQVWLMPAPFIGSIVFQYDRQRLDAALLLPTNKRHHDSELGAMGIRRAVQSDVARIMEIRNLVRENRLSDPNLVTAQDCTEFIARSEIWVWEAEDIVQGFAAGDIRDGWIWVLFVAPEYEGRGIGKALLSMACETLRNAGYAVADLTTAEGTRAERFYTENGWTVVNKNGRGELLFNKRL